MYICTFSLCVLLCVSSQEEDNREEENREEKEVWGQGWWWWRQVVKKIHWKGQVEIVSKTLNLKKTLKTFFVKYGSDHFSFLTVTMMGGITGGDFTPLVIAWAWKNTDMVQKTTGSCPSRVSDVAVKGLEMLGLFLFSGEGNGEMLQGYSHIAMVTNTLKHKSTNSTKWCFRCQKWCEHAA